MKLHQPQAHHAAAHLPDEFKQERPFERLHRLAQSKDRSVNYLAVEAILEFLKREGKPRKP